MKAAFLIIFALMSTAAFAKGRALTIMDYFGGAVRGGDVVCEVVKLESKQTRCYLAVSATRVLTPNDDPSGVLQKGSVNPNQRAFTRVSVEQIIAELERGAIKQAAPIDVYVKVKWEAKDSGPLGKRLAHNHIVHGKLTLGETGAFKFEVTNVPDMILLGLYNPSLDVAEVFGRKITAENNLIEQDMKLWLESILSAVVPQAIHAVTAPPKN